MTQEQIILGGGLIFPIQLDNTGKPVTATGSELIRSSIRIILAYAIGDRFFLREFGANTDNLLGEPNTQLLEDILQQQILRAITKYEKRVKNVKVEVTNNGDTKLDIKLTYDIRHTQQQDYFIYPFYKDIQQ